MGLLKKIGAALRGGQHDTIQHMVDVQAIRILEQEIRDCQQSMAKAKADMTKIVAERKANERELEQFKIQVSVIEKRAMNALDEEDTTLASHLSGQIADIEKAREEQILHRQKMLEMESQLRDNLLAADRQIKQYLRELRLVRACENSQKGLNKSHAQGSELASHLQEVKSSIARIRERRQQTSDMASAARSVDQMLGEDVGDDADRRGGEVLVRLRQQQMAKTA